MCEREGISCESKSKDQALPEAPNLQGPAPLWSIFTVKYHHHTHPISTTTSPLHSKKPPRRLRLRKEERRTTKKTNVINPWKKRKCRCLEANHSHGQQVEMLEQGLYLCSSGVSCPCTALPWCPGTRPPAHPSPNTIRLWMATSAQDTMHTRNTAFFPTLLVSRVIGPARMVLALSLLSVNQHFHPGFDSWSSYREGWTKMPSAYKVSITLLFCIHFHLIKIHTLNKSLSLDHWTKALI